MSKWLTKSNYLNYLISPAYLWLQKYEPHRLPPVSEGGEFLAEQGDEIERYARQIMSDGVEVQGDLFEGIDNSAPLLESGKQRLYQASVLTERKLYARADILDPHNGAWDLYEVKSSTRPKFSHYHDQAFQKIAFEEAGYKIGRMFVVHVNSRYVRKGEIDPKQLLKVTEVTEEVENLLSRTIKGINGALEVLALPKCPDDTPLGCNQLGRWLEVYRHLYPDLPLNSVYNLFGLNPGLLKDLMERGIELLEDVPEDIELNPRQAAQVLAVKSQRPHIRHDTLQGELDKLAYPLYFLDYETVGPAVPLYDGTRPYQAIPFQYSLHIIDEPGGEVRQTEFLSDGRELPVKALLEQLLADLGPTGTVIVWHKDFEMGCNDTMAKLAPKYAWFLKGVNNRIYDLKEIFSELHYVDHRFRGSASIKDVLPVLVPELSYKELEIQKGDVASLRWYKAATGRLTAEEAGKVMRDLRVYCGQDTLAMVRIYEFLQKALAATPAA